MNWEADHLHIALGGSCERWVLQVLAGLSGRAYLTYADTQYRRETGAPVGWQLRCETLCLRTPLEAEDVEGAKAEARARIVGALERRARDVRG